MARQRKLKLVNSFDKDQLGAFLSRIDDAEDEIASLKGEFMESCKDPRSRIKETMADVKEAGINRAAFAEVLHEHRAKRAQERRLAKLEQHDHDDYVAMSMALGVLADTELGQAALKRASERKAQQEDSVDSLTH